MDESFKIGLCGGLHLLDNGANFPLLTLHDIGLRSAKKRGYRAFI